MRIQLQRISRGLLFNFPYHQVQSISASSSEIVEDAIMESPASETKPVSSFQPFMKAERIKQLNDIDKGITQLLQSAGLAIKTLTVCQTNSASVEDGPQSFTDATNTYLKGLHSVDVLLKRQIYGLHEAGIISMAKESPSGPGGQNSDNSRVAGNNVVLDVGWLNSRSGKVGRDMEAELWAKARAFLEELEAKGNVQNQGESEVGVEDQDMGD